MASRTRKAPSAAEKEAEDIYEQVKGHDSLVLDIDGEEYTFTYDRQTVKEMEADGFDVNDATDFNASSYTRLSEFILGLVKPGLRKHHPELSDDDILALWEKVPEKDTVIQYLVALYMQPALAITTNPTQSRAKFRLV